MLNMHAVCRCRNSVLWQSCIHGDSFSSTSHNEGATDCRVWYSELRRLEFGVCSAAVCVCVRVCARVCARVRACMCD